MALKVIDNILTDKRQAEKMLPVEAKQQQSNGKKTNMPNTTRSQDGFSAVTNLQVFNEGKDVETLHHKKRQT